MKLFYLCFLLLVCSFMTANSQTTTITIGAGADWSDAALIKSLKSSESGMANTNYNTYPRIASTAWTHSGSQISYRTLLKFDLTGIPAGITVQSAVLQLYSDPANASGEISNQPLSGSNAFYLHKVTQAWTPTAVTWNNQPTSTTTGRVWVGQSVSGTENIAVNITALVQGMVNNPATNYGLLMKLENEVYYRSRSYASSNHTNPDLRPRLVITFSSPVTVHTEWFDAIEAVFQNVNRTPVTTGLLTDYGLLITNPMKFNGVPSDSNYVAYEDWQALYTSLYTSSFNNNATLASPETVFDQIETTAVQNLGTHMVTGLHYHYEQFKANAVSSNLVYVSNNKIYDTPNRPQSPYEVKEAFAIAPKHDELDGAFHAFLFKPEYFYTNTGKTISAIQFDAGDGAGYQPVSFNTPFYANYTTEGEKTMRFKITYTDNSVKESYSKVSVVNIVHQVPLARTAALDSSFLFTGTRTFRGPNETVFKAGKATITIAYDNEDKVFDKPFIVIEGYDPWKIVNADKPWKNYSFEKFLNGDDETETVGLTRQIDYEGYTTLGDAIKGEGFDIVFVDFDNGTDYIERNAYMVQDLIKWVNSKKVAVNGVKQKNVVMGASMGGMVGRYALRDMELNSVSLGLDPANPHDTKLFITFDAGHQGTNTPLGLQAMVVNGYGTLLKAKTVFPITALTGTYQSTKNVYKLLNEPASKQMLIYSIVGNGITIGTNNYIHDTFYEKYSKMGWPLLARTVAVASGSECGTPQAFGPGAKLYEDKTVNLSGRISKSTVWALSNQNAGKVFETSTKFTVRVLLLINVTVTINSFSFNSKANYLPLDNAPGGTQYLDKRGKLKGHIYHQLFCFVPVYSALDAGGGLEPITYNDVFRNYSPSNPPIPPKNVRAANFFSNPTKAGVANELHVQITKENAIWVFEEMLGMNPTFSCGYTCGIPALDISISGTNTICNSAEQFTLVNAPSGASPVWSISPNLNYLSGQGTGTYTVTPLGNGGGWIKAIVEAGCGTVHRQINIYSGSIAAGDYSINGPTLSCAFQQVTFQASSLAGASYDWYWPSDWIYVSGQYGSTLTLQTPQNSSNAEIGVYMANACGPATSPAVIYVNSEDCGIYALTFSPNPTKDRLSIELSEEDVTGKQIEKVEIVDGSGAPLKLWTGSSRKAELDISSLPRGFCYARVSVSGKTTTARIIIE